MSPLTSFVMKHAIASLAFLLAGTALAADKPAVTGAVPGQWTMDFEAAGKVAAEKKLPIFINFTGSDWCGWCKLMDKSVFSQPAWQAYAKDHLVLVWIDFPNDKSLVPEKFVARNRALAEQFGVEGYPTYIILDEDGKTRLGQLGADRGITPERFIAQLKAVLKNRAAEVEKLLGGMPEQTAQEYRTTASRLETARRELKTIDDAYAQKSAELGKQIKAQEAQLAAIRLKALLAKLPADQAAAYTAKQERAAKVTAELEAWMATQPEKSESNLKKFTAWREELATLETEMQTLLNP